MYRYFRSVHLGFTSNVLKMSTHIRRGIIHGINIQKKKWLHSSVTELRFISQRSPLLPHLSVSQNNTLNTLILYDTEDCILPLLCPPGMPPSSSTIYWPGPDHRQQLSFDFPVDLLCSQHPKVHVVLDPAGKHITKWLKIFCNYLY